MSKRHQAISSIEVCFLIINKHSTVLTPCGSNQEETGRQAHANLKHPFLCLHCQRLNAAVSPEVFTTLILSFVVANNLVINSICTKLKLLSNPGLINICYFEHNLLLCRWLAKGASNGFYLGSTFGTLQRHRDSDKCLLS